MKGTDPKLLTVVAQDARTNNVLMVAHADARALRASRRTGWMHYWSRSRKALWLKGATSGNRQKVASLLYDCDRDAVLARVVPEGPACHKGTRTCFTDREFRSRGILDELWEVFRDRKKRPRKGSYTSQLLRRPDRIAKKVVEEAGELAIASRGRKKEEVVREAADLLYHALLLLFSSGVPLKRVERELERRRAPHRGHSDRS